jgi:hypothetical protein
LAVFFAVAVLFSAVYDKSPTWAKVISVVLLCALFVYVDMADQKKKKP